MDKAVGIILSAIKCYAGAYKSLERLQSDYKSWLQVGDQKTGVFGEFYALRYLRAKYGSDNVKLETPSKETDIKVLTGKGNRNIQVKTVSRYSKTRTISPIHSGYDELHLILLDEEFEVVGYWVTKENILGYGLKMPDPENPKRGSRKLSGCIRDVTDDYHDPISGEGRK